MDSDDIQPLPLEAAHHRVECDAPPAPAAASGSPPPGVVDDRKSLRRLGHYPLRKSDQGTRRHFRRNYLRRQGPQGSRRHARSQASPRPVEVMTIHGRIQRCQEPKNDFL